MRNHFIFAYAGNKRSEAAELFKHIDFNEITTIIEPFCGTSAISFFISTKLPKQFNYILNDNNKYIVALYRLMKDEQEIDTFNEKVNKFIEKFNTYTEDESRKKFYIEQITPDTLISYFLRHKYYSIRAGLYPPIKRSKQLKEFNLRDYPIYNFLKTETVTISQKDGIELIKENMENKKCLIILDPPYMASQNHFYLDPSTNVYEFLSINNINDMKAKVFLVLENVWIVKLLFKSNLILSEYDKLYQNNKKKTTHLILAQKPKNVNKTDS